MRAFKLLAVRDISLADADPCLGVLNQDHSITGYCRRRLHFTVLIDREGCLCCYSVAFRCHCLTKNVLDAGLQAFDLMGFLAGCPRLYDLFISFFVHLDDLDLSAFKFFAVCDVDFAHTDPGLGIIDQESSVFSNST